VLKRPHSRACALETTASFLALPVPCAPEPREDARGRDALGDEGGMLLDYLQNIFNVLLWSQEVK
jgi:hypothetical protein